MDKVSIVGLDIAKHVLQIHGARADGSVTLSKRLLKVRLLANLACYTAEDPKTIAGVGHRSKGGYIWKLDKDALKGKRIGLYGLGWRSLPLSDEATQLYERAGRAQAARCSPC